MREDLQIYQSFALHRFETHGIKHIVRKYSTGSQCPICLIEWWTRERAINHVRYRKEVCKRNLLLHAPELTAAEADELDMQDARLYRNFTEQGKRRHIAERPCMQAEGPFVHIILDPARMSVHHPLGMAHCWKRWAMSLSPSPVQMYG